MTSSPLALAKKQLNTRHCKGLAPR